MIFLEGLPFNQMVGDNEYVERGLCLALAGDAYLVYLPEGAIRVSICPMWGRGRG